MPTADERTARKLGMTLAVREELGSNSFNIFEAKNDAGQTITKCTDLTGTEKRAVLQRLPEKYATATSLL